MKDILFLDIDGVLNRRGTRERCNHFLGVDRELSNKLLSWLRTTNVNIVLSSTWRNHPEMWEHLHEAGIYWIDKTPRLFSGCRGHEIQHWLDVNDDQSPVPNKEFLWDRYAILDDNSDMLDEQMSRFVQTDTDVGITDEHIDKLKALFHQEAVSVK